uniref:Uncharacterized protein n=1 Tax=Arundo donax TaxID=35708 RepID=A0A0A8ZWG5_ARUDO
MLTFIGEKNVTNLYPRPKEARTSTSHRCKKVNQDSGLADYKMQERSNPRIEHFMRVPVTKRNLA